MSDIAIRVDNLSKLYPELSARAGHLGARQQRPDTLRDALTGAFACRRRNGPAPTDHRSRFPRRPLGTEGRLLRAATPPPVHLATQPIDGIIPSPNLT
ncbi:MAG: hypothetical protein V9H69_07100 [Anaerolineae bacterium]